MTIDFEDGVDIYWARQQVSERLGGLTESLPAGITGGMAPITTPLGEMFMFTVDGEGYTLAGSPTLAFSGEKVIAGQALVWSGRVPAVAPAAPASQAVAVTAETGEPADGADPDGTTRVDRPEPVGQED